MKQLSMKTQASPAVVSGGYYFQSFGEFEKVTAAMIQGNYEVSASPGGVNAPAISGMAIQAQTAIVSGNQVQVLFQKLPAGQSGAAIVCGSGDLISNSVTVLAAGI